MVFFTIYSNFTLIPEFTFAKLQDFLLNWNLLFQFTSKATVQKALDETQLLFDSLMQQYFG